MMMMGATTVVSTSEIFEKMGSLILFLIISILALPSLLIFCLNNMFEEMEITLNLINVLKMFILSFLGILTLKILTVLILDVYDDDDDEDN